MMEADDFEIEHGRSSDLDGDDEFGEHVDDPDRLNDDQIPDADERSSDAGAVSDNVRDHRRALRIYGAVTVLFAVSIAALGLFGYRRSVDLTGGINPEAAALDRDQPGYEATVKATPVTLLVLTNGDGKLASISVAALRPDEDGGGGTMMVLPLPTLVEHPGTDADMFVTAFADGGIDQLRVDVETAIGFGVSSTIVLDPSQFAAALKRGVPIVNPDTIYMSSATGGRTIAFDSGSITIPPDRAAEYLGTLGDGEDEVNRTNRGELFWTAVLTGKGASDSAAVNDLMPGAVVPATAPTSGDGLAGPSGASGDSGASGASATPGSAPDPSTTGIAGATGAASVDSAGEDTSAAVSKARALLADLTASSSTVFRAPTEEVPLGLPGGIFISTFKVEQDDLNQKLAEFVPIPSSAFAGQRAAVLLLNGTTKLDQQLQFIDQIVSSGATITAVGNAARLDEKTSTVVYFDDANKAAAERIAGALKLTATKSSDSRTFDVVVTIGSDLMP